MSELRVSYTKATLKVTNVVNHSVVRVTTPGTTLVRISKVGIQGPPGVGQAGPPGPSGVADPGDLTLLFDNILL